MRLNVGKCKVMHFGSKTTPIVIKLNNTIIAPVPIYKYLGFHVNEKLNSDIQWHFLEPMISKNIHLLKQLKNTGLPQPILINVYKSLVLSHFRYSSTILVSCSAKANTDMQTLQNTLLRTIGIHTTDLAVKAKYDIIEVSEYIRITCLSQVTRILDTDGHALRERFLIPPGIVKHSPCPFWALPKTKSRNAVNLTLIHLRDAVYGTGRSNLPPPPPPPRPSIVLDDTNSEKCPIEVCVSHETGRRFTRLYQHMRLAHPDVVWPHQLPTIPTQTPSVLTQPPPAPIQPSTALAVAATSYRRPAPTIMPRDKTCPRIYCKDNTSGKTYANLGPHKCKPVNLPAPAPSPPTGDHALA